MIAGLAIVAMPRAALADEPVSAREKRLMQETGENTTVIDAFDEDDPFDSTFATLLAYCASTGVAIPNAAALISFNEVYSLVRGTGQSLAELAADSTDYKALIAQAGKPSDRLALARRLATQRLARGVVPELDACFAALDLQSLPTGAQPVPSP